MKHVLRPTLSAAAMLAALGIVGTALAAAPTTEKDKASYVVGMDMANNIPPIVREELNPAVVAEALRTVLSGQKTALSEQDAQAIRQAFVTKLKAKAEAAEKAAAAKNKAEGDAYLAKNKTRPGVKVTPSGLQYEVVSMGTGPKPGPNDTVQINYTGTLVDGTKFDASADHGGPAALPLASVFPGFKEAMQLMPEGSHFKFAIPSNLAYGDKAASPVIGPNSTLLFDVTLLKANMPASQPQAQPQGK